MLGSSAASLARLTEELGRAVDGGADAPAVGDGLLGAASLLRTQGALRRAITDPSAGAEAKAGLARSVFGSRIDAAATELIASAAGSRWGSSLDLADAVEELGVIAIVRGAETSGDADRLEDELFTVAQAVSGNPGLRDALSDPARSVTDKQGLVSTLLSGRATAATERLACEAVAGTHQTVVNALESYARTAAAARQRLVATVRVVRPLTAEQSSRLATALGRDSGRPVHLNVVVDQALVGGIHVEIGDYVVDGSISGRVDDARRRIAG